MEPKPEQPLLTFPCPFAIKIVGENLPDFEPLVLELLSKHVPNIAAAKVSQRTSSADKYLSVTVDFTADSRAQLDAIYLELSANKRILFLV